MLSSKLARLSANGKATNQSKMKLLLMGAYSYRMHWNCHLDVNLLQVRVRVLLLSCFQDLLSHIHIDFTSDFKSRETETKQMNFLLEMNKRYPHAWYARRFFNKVNVSEKFGSHFGMGLDCYVQWSSPIRRLTDLQVHSALKRYLRRRRVNTMLQAGLSIPSELTNMDLGYDISNLRSAQSTKEDKINAIDPIDYTSGLGMIFAGRPVQSSSSTYWLFKKIQQLTSESEEEVMFESIILGCINRDRFQYSIYVYELGFEHRYVSETGKLEEGQRLWLKVASVNPRLELLMFSLASKSGGMNAKKKQYSAPAA